MKMLDTAKNSCYYMQVCRTERYKNCHDRHRYLASNDNRRCHMYAIIATGGKQYKVAEGDIINVEKLGVEAGETVTFDQVLAVSNDGSEGRC